MNVKQKLQLLIWTCLILSVLFTTYFILAYKNDLEISDSSQKIQIIDQATDLGQLKQTSRMYVNFLYGVHGAAVSLWLLSVIYGAVNIIILISCAWLVKCGDKPKDGIVE